MIDRMRQRERRNTVPGPRLPSECTTRNQHRHSFIQHMVQSHRTKETKTTTRTPHATDHDHNAMKR